MKPISPIRWDAPAGYARGLKVRFLAEEVGWYERANERVLGLVIRDYGDNDYGRIIFRRDKALRYRSGSISNFDKKLT